MVFGFQGQVAGKPGTVERPVTLVFNTRETRRLGGRFWNAGQLDPRDFPDLRMKKKSSPHGNALIEKRLRIRPFDSPFIQKSAATSKKTRLATPVITRITWNLIQRSRSCRQFPGSVEGVHVTIC
jgi:hypothetical protein